MQQITANSNPTSPSLIRFWGLSETMLCNRCNHIIQWPNWDTFEKERWHSWQLPQGSMHKPELSLAKQDLGSTYMYHRAPGQCHWPLSLSASLPLYSRFQFLISTQRFVCFGPSSYKIKVKSCTILPGFENLCLLARNTELPMWTGPEST